MRSPIENLYRSQNYVHSVDNENVNYRHSEKLGNRDSNQEPFGLPTNVLPNELLTDDKKPY